MEICSSHYKEELAWLSNSPWPVTIVHHDGGSEVTEGFHKVLNIPNKGRESSAYLAFIITRYDNLPDFTAFIHGHEEAYHQLGDRPLLDLIRDANINKYEYVPLNNNWRWINTASQLELFKDFIVESGLFKIIPDFYITDAGGQFIVSREVIRRNSKQFYENLMNIVMNSEKDIEIAVCLELVWCLIFQQGILFPVKPDYFEPPIEKLKFWSPFPDFPPHIVFINCSVDIPGIPNVKTKEEYEKEFKNGSFYILFGDEPEFEIEPPMFNLKNYDMFEIQKIIRFAEIMNLDWIKELQTIKHRNGRD